MMPRSSTGRRALQGGRSNVDAGQIADGGRAADPPNDA
jgi:hypothetical protein